MRFLPQRILMAIFYFYSYYDSLVTGGCILQLVLTNFSEYVYVA